MADELHQVFVPGRGPSLIDCGMELTGTGVVIHLVYQFSKSAGIGMSSDRIRCGLLPSEEAQYE